MKTQTLCKRPFTWPRYVNTITATVVLCLLSMVSYSQSVNIVSPVTNLSYKLPDPDSLQGAEAFRGAITTAELAGHVLSADATAERTGIIIMESDFDKATSMKNDYVTGVDNYTNNGYKAYMTDFNNYTPDVANYNQTLERHNTAVAASNALAATQRNAATVASLNSEKTDLDNWKVKLDNWKSNLDAAKSRLDEQRSALMDQKHQYESALQTASDKLKIGQVKLKDILDQLILCAYYTDKCKAALAGKFNNSDPSGTGYFVSAVYKSAIADLKAEIEKLKSSPGVIW